MLITKCFASIFKCFDTFSYWTVIYFRFVNKSEDTVNPLGTFAVGNRDSYFFTYCYCALEI